MRVRVLPGVPISRACGLTRTAEGPDSESGSLGGASPFMPTISRRLASAGTADPGDLKPPSLPGASPGSPTNLRSSSCASASRRVVNREQQTGSTQDRTALGVQVSPRRRSQFGMSTGRAIRACLLNSALLETGVWRKSTAFRHFRAFSSKRTVQLITGVALDECRVPERYRKRAPFRPCGVAQPTRLPLMQEITGAKPVRDAISRPCELSAGMAMRAAQSNQRSGRRHKPAAPRAALGTATIFASTQQSADFFCNEIVPEHRRAGGSNFQRAVVFGRYNRCGSCKPLSHSCLH